MDIPAQIEVDVSPLEIGHGLKVGDITLPPNVTNSTPDLALVSVLAPTVIAADEELHPEATEATAETAEGQAAEGAEQSSE